MKKRTVIIISLLSAISGLFLSKPVKNVVSMFEGEKSVQCVTQHICVGNSVDMVFGLYESDPLGGLDAIFCGVPGAGRENIEYIFISDIVDGKTCGKANYSLTYATQFHRTVIVIRDGTIDSLRRGPRHTLDL